MSVASRDVRFVASASSGEVSATFERPPGAEHALVLAHGAGAGMRHPFLNALTGRLVERGVAVFRYQFPYMEQGSRRPNPAPILQATVRAAIGTAREVAGDLPLFAGGKSMGGRMTSLALSHEADPAVCGIVFFGFPLHPAGRESSERGVHLAEVSVPLLFLQGTRDALADLERLTPLVEGLGASSTLRIVEGADHSFHVLKRSGRSDEEVLDELADATRVWMEKITAV